MENNREINGEILDRCYCIDNSLKLVDFEIDYYTKCFYRQNEESFSVFMEYGILPISRITGRLNVPLHKQYNISYEKFYKHFRTLAEWRQNQIDSIINDN